MLPEQSDSAAALDRSQLASYRFRCNPLRGFTHQAEQHRTIGRMPGTGQGQRSVQRHLHLHRLLQRQAFHQKATRRQHRPNRMRTGRPDADFKDRIPAYP